MRKLLLGAVIGAAAFGAALVGSGTAQAQEPPPMPLVIGCGGLVFCIHNPVVFDPPLSGFDDPRLGPGPQTGNPNPILDFGLILIRPSVLLPAGQDMHQPLCHVPPGPCQ